MQFQTMYRAACQYVGLSAALLSTVFNLVAPPSLVAQSTKTATPVKHVIVIIGENRTFDHIFATYKPKAGETVSNLLSKGIVNADGTPGPNYSLTTQYSAVDSTTVGTGLYSSSPADKTIYANDPPVVAGGFTNAPVPNVAIAKLVEPGFLPNNYYKFLTTGGTGLPKYTVVDSRIPNVNSLPNGVFQLTPGVMYDDYANSPVHRFYQMWQQEDCNASYATKANPSGCLADLFPWVEVTIGAGSDGSSGSTSPPTNFISTGEGSTSMEFYNMRKGRRAVPEVLGRQLHNERQFSSVGEGGTGLNHIMFGFADGDLVQRRHG